MAFSITERAKEEAQKTKLEPQLVLEIEGVSSLFGAEKIYQLIRIGDPGLTVGDSWKIGGLALAVDQADVISFDGGTSTAITQQLQPDKGAVSSVSSVQVALNDRNLIATQLISPGITLPEILGANATLWMGFKNTAFKDDYIPVFSGIIDDVQSGSGQVIVNLAHPDQKKRQTLFTPVTVQLSGTIDELAASVPLVDALGIYTPKPGPDGSFDPAMKFYVKIEDEVIQYTGITGNTLTGCIRGALGTVPVKHTIYKVVSIVCFADNNFSLAGKHFLIHSARNAIKYYVWFKVWNPDSIPAGYVGADPALPGATGILVTLNKNDTAATVAAGVNAALGAVGDFSTSLDGTTVTATNVNYGKTSDASNGNSGFDVSTVDDGTDPIDAATIVSLSDTAINCALKLMLSGVNGYAETGVAIKRYLHPTPLTTVANSIYFDALDLNRDLGIVAGDYITISGATSGANNCTMAKIQEIDTVDGGSYAIIEGVSFVSELSTAAVASFRSQYDTLGYGLAMSPFEVDVLEHLYWQDTLLANDEYQFWIDGEINGKDFLDQEVYLPVGAFSLPRKGRCSMGYHIGPIVRDDIKVLNRNNIKNPHQIKLRRTINRNFYNTIVYQFDKQLDGSFSSGVITQDADSQSQIKVGNKAFIVASAGMRRALNGTGIAENASYRYLSRYKLAAEFIEAIGVFFRDGYNVEPGDVVMLDPTGLKISNTHDGTRDKPAKLFMVMNSRVDLKTGDVSFMLTDANFDGSERYGSVAPSSLVVSGTTTSILLQDSFGSIFPGKEWKKWENYTGLTILVHSTDWTFAETVTFQGFDPANPYNLLLDPATPLTLAPTAGMIVEAGSYPSSTDRAVNSPYKAVHAFLSNSVAIVSAPDSTHFVVASGDVSKFTIGGAIRVHNPDFSNDSGEIKVLGISGTTIQTNVTMGFTPDNTCLAENLPFPDGGATYKVF